MSAPKFFRWTAAIVLALLLGSLFSYFGLAAAWILAGILASATVAMTTHHELPLHRLIDKSARGVIGVLAGIPMAVATLDELTAVALPGLLVSILTIAIGFGFGLLLAKREPSISGQTGILCLLPGGSSTMPAIAKETGAHFQLVSLTQYLRLLIVSSSLPILGSFLDHGENAPHASANSDISSPGVLALLVVFAVAGPHLGKLLRLPAPHLFAPMLLTVGLAALLPDATIALPWEMKVASHILIGFMCGGGITPATLKLFAKQIPMVLAAVAATIGACALTAWGIMEWLGIPYFDAYLATSPGGLETVISLATEAEHSPTIITLQLIRVTIIMLIAGCLAPIINFLTRRR
ncbi:putative membrane protein AbrB [Corynebacterium sp. CMW7794]|uniref:AbrB family transcriptional regulator n=1 Tax=Corynebacterium sp. CMW7794 TaxID=1603887 RepID=UPI000799124D|nr:AbrB family transcriptional regulator [Corynebacterium sp. CMW7794]KXI19305.1 putative membrane protein AbrB [Corynebacterium sp. CMW7794]